ncbi:hypothetical protein F4680DRAFT_433512 [Xylaria scruposa]|nr:hypothetical protein F4680DRAFT_433512 [Xylaria scruposa]
MKAISIVREKLDFDPESGYGHGVLCLIETPLQDGVLDIRWVNLIVTQTSRWHLKPDELHFSRVIYFLGVFAGFWLSRNERLRFACSKSPGFDFLNWYLQVHLRYFADAAQPIKSKDAGGLQCTREKGGIVSNSLKVVLRSFEEKRISVFGYFRIDDYSPSAFYSVLALRETKFSDLDGYILKWRPGLQGTIAFQFAVLASVDTWETEWNKVLDQIDDCVYFHLEQTLDPNEINTWMFDDNFERSRLYFNILQFLRIFGEWIGTVSDDLRPLDDLFLKRTDFPMREMRQDELQALRSNWKLVRETQETAQKNLMDRVLNKTEEIKSLRDGLFNTSSLREAKESSRQANRSSEMSRYVLIFTVVTVLYLPPSFISTVFALEIFKKDPAQTKWEYKVALVSVSLFTYTMALALVIAADWKKFRGRCSSWWIKFSQWRGDSLSGENTSGSLDDSASDVPASLAQEQEGSKPKEARPAREAGDEESGPHEAKKQRFFRFPGTSKSGEPSDRKGKAPENIPMTAVSTSNK